MLTFKQKKYKRKLINNQLSSTRGKIHVDDFLECYPQAHIEEVDMLSLVEKIKEQSFEDGAAKQHGEVTFASLKQDLKKLAKQTKNIFENNLESMKN